MFRLKNVDIVKVKCIYKGELISLECTGRI